jgi:hypothetical protein
MKFFEVQPFLKEYLLSEALKIIKIAVLSNIKTLGRWVTYETEGFLDRDEAVVLNILVSVPTRSPFGVLEQEKVAIALSEADPQKLKAFSLRKNFPSLPHLNLTYKDKPKQLCLFNVPQMDRVYNETCIAFVIRVKKWLDRAASGELHLSEQAMEPFIIDSAGYFVVWAMKTSYSAIRSPCLSPGIYSRMSNFA